MFKMSCKFIFAHFPAPLLCVKLIPKCLYRLKIFGIMAFFCKKSRVDAGETGILPYIIYMRGNLKERLFCLLHFNFVRNTLHHLLMFNKIKGFCLRHRLFQPASPAYSNTYACYFKKNKNQCLVLIGHCVRWIESIIIKLRGNYHSGLLFIYRVAQGSPQATDSLLPGMGIAGPSWMFFFIRLPKAQNLATFEKKNGTENRMTC